MLDLAQEMDPEELFRTLQADCQLPVCSGHPGMIPLDGQPIAGVLERALDALCAGDEGIEKFVLHRTDEFVTFYDGLPKASVHLLVVPRERIAGLQAVDTCHLQLLKRMAAYVCWVMISVSHQHPELPGWAHGVHAVPTLRQLHYHVISQDFDSVRMNAIKTFNSFQPPFLVPLDDIIDELEGNFDLRGRFRLPSVENELKRDLCCHRCGSQFGKNIEGFREHLGTCTSLPTSTPLPSRWKVDKKHLWKQAGELAQQAWRQQDWAGAIEHLGTCVRLRPEDRKSYNLWLKALAKQGQKIAGTRGSDNRVNVVLDMETDDPDDFICLIFLASHPQINLKAVTISPGSTTQVGLVRWLLQRLGKDIAVGAGDIDHPSPAVSPWHADAFFGGEEIPPSRDAEVAWQVLVRECNEETTLFTGGPLLNVAEAITRRGDNFVVGTWLAQGGFAGDVLVPQDALLSKFAGKSRNLTTNFGREYGSAVSLAAHAALAHEGFRQRLLVSKNVCHHHSNSFEAAHLDRLFQNIQSRGITREAVARVALESTDEDNFLVGQCLLAHGMREYLRRKDGKLMHDPLAAMVILDPRVIDLWCEVNMTQHIDGTWGATAREYSFTFISLRHKPDVFWTVFLDSLAFVPLAYNAPT
eukprot:TRINITY_DN7434_c0_g1_i1.p1 TRINITY_DN7434_c0_g1~~TRINITY_DN7434_c0_g1_i1.p1  ORF type:complete len:640 (+),score=71.27 TRINITY_DN7434_c0_g1_i1:98-2017(+)